MGASLDPPGGTGSLTLLGMWPPTLSHPVAIESSAEDKRSVGGGGARWREPRSARKIKKASQRGHPWQDLSIRKGCLQATGQSKKA